MALMVVECVEREGMGGGGSLSGMWRGTPASSGCGVGGNLRERLGRVEARAARCSFAEHCRKQALQSLQSVDAVKQGIFLGLEKRYGVAPDCQDALVLHMLGLSLAALILC